MIEEELRRALAALVDGLPPRQAAGAVERLMTGYRGAGPEAAPVLRDRADVVAYAAYRMPATFAAVASALGAFAERADGWRPASHLDLGGGTGAAVWAAAQVWDDADGAGPVCRTTVFDRSESALGLGRELAATSTAARSLRETSWQRRSLTGQDHGAGAPSADDDGDEDSRGDGRGDGRGGLPGADLVTVSYVLGELPEAERSAVVEAAARAGTAVVVTEPGTPAGYERIIAARDRLVEAGLRVLAPCPHSAPCPIAPGEDWCHFAARVHRSSLHRQVKGGSLPYEDEKFSYVAAARPEAEGGPAAARIVRRPQKRKGQVLLDLCTATEGLRRTTVTKRHGAEYRQARDAKWGDAWPP